MYVCTAPVHILIGYIPERRENMFNVNIKHVNGFLEDDTAAVGLFQRGRKTVPGSSKCCRFLSPAIKCHIYLS